jgi:mRNA-degrading endonuclease RelE of RelBE toxin-antitoxin system
MFEIVLEEQARRQLARLPNEISGDILRKLRWLGENAEVIKHERLKGLKAYSLHCGQYRIPYLLDWTNRVITVMDIDKHDEAYRRLKRR